MTAADYRVRRANLEDRPWLVPLWQSVRLPAAELDRRLTEFQVIESGNGQPLGALGLQISGQHGCIHSEAYADFGFADHFRPLLWERVQQVAASHGLLRIWTQEQSPFWSGNGFRPADAEALRQLPDAWSRSAAPWLMIQLREDGASSQSLEEQIQRLMEEERQHTVRLLQRAKMLKTLATLLAIALAFFVIAAAVYLLRKNPAILGR